MLFRIFTLCAVIALAVSTWILSTPGRNADDAAPVPAANRPGYFLKNATLTDFDAAGDPSLRVTAERIDQVGHGTEVALYNIRVDYQAPSGTTWVLTGDTAHVQPGGKVVDVSGNVRLQGEESGRTDVAVIRSDEMSYNVADAVASTKDDVRIDFGLHTLTARGLIANLKDRTVHLESRVNGRFHP
jgi:LPS export ABC transporter protein LptC